jgi:putative oxidoreductase
MVYCTSVARTTPPNTSPPITLKATAISFLIVGSLSIIAGYKARMEARLQFVFLVVATFSFHDFWNFDGWEQQMQIDQFMKNLSLIGTMLYLIASGAGPMSLDARVAANDAESHSP